MVFGSSCILRPGEHELRFKGVSVDYTRARATNFIADVTFHLTISPDRR